MRYGMGFAVALSLAIGAGSSEAREDDIRVLFVGNSLTYVGNLPAVFDAVARANGRPASSQMIVQPGGTLTDRVKDGAVERALSKYKYSFVVFQERGGDFMCGFGPKVCEDARNSLNALTATARRYDAVPVLMGTYQGDPVWSERIVDAESKAANVLGERYISVSDRFQRGRSTEPQMEWLFADGMHPGRDLVLLEALLLYEALFDESPSDSAIAVDAPIYSPSSGLTPNLRSASDPPPRKETPIGTRYDSAHMAELIKLVR
jgi:hypothetical protein